MTASPGSTVVVNLPTGSGKTLCALAPALAYGVDEGELPGVTPIIVPTVALAADLDRRFRSVLGHPIAYRPADRAEAANMRARVAAGQQGPLLTSPESLIGSLRDSLCHAAKRGLLRGFVVDEAHMVTAWGDEFRPAFQQIPGARRELAIAAGQQPFVTALMSATFSEYALAAMTELFPPIGANGEFRAVHAVRLRPEPIWWSDRVYSEDEREGYVLDAVMHLPRPVIVYALKREDVSRIYRLLRANGHNRVAAISGTTDDSEREQLLARWNANGIDVMVATSAFGLGVDKPDIRAVVHAALPEGLDRLYQDVGRGGRDGRASASILFWHGQDWGPAAAIASPTLIGAERGRQRWQAMFHSPTKIFLGEDRYSLNVAVQPSGAPGDIDMDSEENQKWNRRTLTLMARANLLAIEGGAVTQDDARMGDIVTVRLLRGGLNDEQLWENEVGKRRQELHAFYRRNLELLQKALRVEDCMARILQECYASDRYGVDVVRACGGCGFCRARGLTPSAGPIRASHRPISPTPPLPIDARLDAMVRGRSPCMIYYDGESSGRLWSQRISRLLWYLIARGIVNVSAPSSLLEHWRADGLASTVGRPGALLLPGRPVFLHEKLPADVTAFQPTVSVFSRDCGDRWAEAWMLSHACDAYRPLSQTLPRPLLFVAPADTTDPTRPERLARLLMPGDSLDDWEEALSE
jgi:superfamily II DNA/RNA helicase